jgi:hypothetical protein
MTVLPRAVAGTELVIDDDEVAIGRSDHDLAVLQLLSLGGDFHRVLPGSLEDAGESAGTRCRNVQHNKDAGRKVSLQRTNECNKAFHTARRGTDNDYVATGDHFRHACRH